MLLLQYGRSSERTSENITNVERAANIPIFYSFLFQF